MIAERGALATIIFLLAYFGLFVSGLRQRKSEEPEISSADQLAPLALTGTLFVTALVGAFDAVLLLGAPTLIAWSAFGALGVPGKPRIEWTPSDGTRRRWITLAAMVGLIFVARSGLQIMAMATNCAKAYAFTLDRCRTFVLER
jgi:hypothetical protein